VVQVRLKGLNADGYEMELEPTLYKILTTLGYEPGVGDPNRFPDGNLLPGLTYADEVNAPFWRKRKAENKVSMTPLGRYSTVIPNSCCIAGWFEQGTGTRHELQRFPGGPPPDGGENQKIFPEATGRIEFSPPANFGIYANNEYSDQGGRPFRFFRARAINGSFRPGLWIVVQDQSGGDAPGMVKNDDYNDFVWLLRNARPA
nr:hypothetical protein [Acidimicrobiia bacterium]